MARMPSHLIRRALVPLLDGIIGVTERVIERLGDPDLRESIERDRHALALCHRRLVEAYAEIDGLNRLVASLSPSSAEQDETRELERSLFDRQCRPMPSPRTVAAGPRRRWLLSGM